MMQPYVLLTYVIFYFIASLFNFEPSEARLIFTTITAVDLNKPCHLCLVSCTNAQMDN
jgi:hypothetical protein